MTPTTPYQYATSNSMTPLEFFKKAWEWRYGSPCRSNKVELDAHLTDLNKACAPHYAWEYLRHLALPRASMPAQVVPR